MQRFTVEKRARKKKSWFMCHTISQFGYTCVRKSCRLARCFHRLSYRFVAFALLLRFAALTASLSFWNCTIRVTVSACSEGSARTWLTSCIFLYALLPTSSGATPSMASSVSTRSTGRLGRCSIVEAGRLFAKPLGKGTALVALRRRRQDMFTVREPTPQHKMRHPFPFGRLGQYNRAA